MDKINSIMKKLLILLFSILILPLSANASDVYYCTDNNHIGYELSDNFKVTDYKSRRFKIKIDFEKKNVISETIFMYKDSVKECIYDNYTKTLYCISEYGTAFSINKNTLNFVRGEIYIEENQEDDYTLAYGKCEKF
jgi:hypothetical protein